MTINTDSADGQIIAAIGKSACATLRTKATNVREFGRPKATCWKLENCSVAENLAVIALIFQPFAGRQQSLFFDYGQ